MRKRGDRRVNRTKDALRQTLLELIVENGYDEISIQDLVDRADVGRSTFYSHYADKDDLLQENMGALSTRIRSQMRSSENDDGHPALAFSRPMLEHVAEVKQMFIALLGPKSARVVHEYFHEVLCDLAGSGLETNKMNTAIPTGVVVQYLAASFLAVARWWVIESPDRTVAEIHNIYTRLVIPTLASI